MGIQLSLGSEIVVVTSSEKSSLLCAAALYTLNPAREDGPEAPHVEDVRQAAERFIRRALEHYGVRQLCVDGLLFDLDGKELVRWDDRRTVRRYRGTVGGLREQVRAQKRGQAP